MVTLCDTRADLAYVRKHNSSLQKNLVHSALLSQDGSTVVLRLANQSIELLPVCDFNISPTRLTPGFGYGLMTLSANGQHLMNDSHRGDAQVWTMSTPQATLRKITMPQWFCDCAM